MDDRSPGDAGHQDHHDPGAGHPGLAQADSPASPGTNNGGCPPHDASDHWSSAVVDCGNCGGSEFASGRGSSCDECEPSWQAFAEEACDDCGARFKVEPHIQDCDWWLPSAAGGAS